MINLPNANRLRLRWFLGVLMSVAALLGIGAYPVASIGVPAAPAVPVDTPPNFVVIVLDDLGTDKLGFYDQPVVWGEDHPDTPVLDSIAADGAVFWNAYASPLCSPSRALILTGRQAYRTGMFNLSDGDPYDLPDSEVLLPEMLKNIDENYATGAFGKWHVTDGVMTGGLRDCFHPIRNGFDVFVGHLHNVGDHFNWPRIDTRLGCAPAMDTNWVGSQVRVDAVDWIQQQDEPFFAYVAFHPPHAPFQVPPLDHVTPNLVPSDFDVGDVVTPSCGACGTCSVETDNWINRTIYRANIEAIDWEIGELLAELPENTYVFIIGDNGTEVSAVQSDNSSANYAEVGAPFAPKHSKRTITQMGARVPLLVIGPDVVPGIRRAPVSAVDIWRTMADLAGDVSATGATDSLSFRQLLEASETWPPPPGARRRAYIEFSVTNKSKWTGTAWTPSTPLKLQRALVSYDGLKYMRFGSSTSTPTCLTLQDCAFVPPDNSSPEEEVHQLYTYAGTYVPCDENEIGTSTTCGSLPTCTSPSVAVLRSIMLSLTGP